MSSCDDFSLKGEKNSTNLGRYDIAETMKDNSLSGEDANYDGEFLFYCEGNGISRLLVHVLGIPCLSSCCCLELPRWLVLQRFGKDQTHTCAADEN